MSLNQLLEAMLEPKREAYREEGREQEKRRTARKTSLMGLSSDQIAEIIDVDQAVVESWLAEKDVSIERSDRESFAPSETSPDQLAKSMDAANESDSELDDDQ